MYACDYAEINEYYRFGNQMLFYDISVSWRITISQYCVDYDSWNLHART